MDGTKSFLNIIKQAKKEGYTEPDPRIDLSGIDVARKNFNFSTRKRIKY